MLLRFRRKKPSQQNSTKPSSPFIRMRPSQGFYKWAWDVVVGCKNGCEYCYAKRLIERRPGRKFENIRFFFDIIDEPKRVPPSTIFVNHYSDIMGDWIPERWIKAVIKTCKECPDHTFIWMTKNPKRYAEFDFPDNCLLGVTIESPAEWWRSEVMENYKNRKMASVEPILGDFTGYDFSQYELVVVGGLWDFKTKTTTTEFIDTVKHGNIFYK